MDLNICIEEQGIRDPDNVVIEKLSRCLQLGFHTVALSVIVDLTAYKNAKKSIPNCEDGLLIPDPPTKELLNSNKKLRVYTRLTVKVSHPDVLYKLHKYPTTATYDLLALEPQNYDILQYIARGNTNLDILTFNLGDRMDFNFFRTKFKTLEEKDVCIEINYGLAQLGSALRRNIICNGQNLYEKTSSSIILSSGVRETFRLRSPMDATSIGVLFMIPQKRCHDTIYKNGNKALQSSKHRKNQTSSAIEIIKE